MLNIGRRLNSNMRIFVTNTFIEIDQEDFKYICEGLSICTKPDGYRTVVFSKGKYKSKYLCRVLMNCPADLEVDHKDGNTLNNQKSNLRIVTSAQNKANTTLRRGSIGHKGVIRHGRGFKATINHNYRQIYLGIFDTEQQTIAAYKKKADELRGEFALHNSREE